MKKNRKKQTNDAPKRLFMILLSFFCGYFLASVYDIKQLGNWLNSRLIRDNPSAQIIAKAKETPPLKPKFEFYTLLSKDNPLPISPENPVLQTTSMTKQEPLQIDSHDRPLLTKSVADSAPEANPMKEKTSPIESVLAQNSRRKESYLIQIASFNKRQDAEHLKASLLLSGFDASITNIPQGSLTWYRVTVGPFQSRPAAEKAQATLFKNEHVKGMVRKIT